MVYNLPFPLSCESKNPFVGMSSASLSVNQMGVKGWHWSCWPFTYRSVYHEFSLRVEFVSLFSLIAVNFPGGRFGNLFDDDPKQWRMYADFIGSAGRYCLLYPTSVIWISNFGCYEKTMLNLCSIFDLTTQLYPAYFLPLASLGNLAKVNN